MNFLSESGGHQRASARQTRRLRQGDNTIAYTLNNAGERTREDVRDAAGTLRRTLSRTYNTLGQLQSIVQVNPDPDNSDPNNPKPPVVTRFTYDADGNLDETTDALNRKTDNNVDPLGRLSRTLQDMNGIAAETQFRYDALDRLTRATDPKGLNTHYDYNGFGELTSLQSPDTGTTTYEYDTAGNRTKQTDARNKVTNTAYDALNRPTAVSYQNQGAESPSPLKSSYCSTCGDSRPRPHLQHRQNLHRVFAMFAAHVRLRA